VPTSAVQRGPVGTFSYVIDSDNVAHAKPVTVTQQNETDAVIANGLSPDDRVVTTGFANLADGAKVIIGSNDQTPSADLAPRMKGSRDPRQGKDGQGKDGQAKDGQGQKDSQGKDGEHRKRREQSEGDQKGATGPAGGEPPAGAAKSQP
jgi:multidrug efflux system membrane fusion protein